MGKKGGGAPSSLKIVKTTLPAEPKEPKHSPRRHESLKLLFPLPDAEAEGKLWPWP